MNHNKPKLPPQPSIALSTGANTRQGTPKLPVHAVGGSAAINTPLTELKEAYECARSVGSTSSRDSALCKVVRQALIAKEYGLALKVADDIKASSTQDSMFMEIVVAAMLEKQVQYARQAAENINSSFTADSAKHKIIDALNP